jgi:hypothetical protein
VPTLVAGALLIVVAVVVLRATGSHGYYWADDYAHLLYSRIASHDWHAMLDVWARPLMTIVYIPAALVGESLSRITSLLLLMVSCTLVAVTARRWGLAHPLLGALLLLAQPLPAMIGFSVLPQTVFSTLLAGAFALRASGHHAASALVISFLPLARLEGIAVLAIWAVVLVIERRYRVVPLLVCGLVLWALCGAIVYSDPLWLYKANPYGLLGSRYGAAGLGYGFLALPSAAGAVIIACALAAIPRLRRIDPALYLTAGGLFAFYVAAWTLPAFQSIATPVYLVCLSVPVALLAHYGVVNALTAFPGPRALVALGLVGAASVALATRSLQVVIVVAGLLAIGVFARRALRPLPHVAGAALLLSVVGLVAFTGVRQIQSLPLTGAARAQLQLVHLLGSDTKRVISSTDPAFDWYAGTETAIGLYQTRRPTVGDYVVWDGNVGAHRISLDALEKQGYTVRWSSGEGVERVVLLEITRASSAPLPLR